MSVQSISGRLFKVDAPKCDLRLDQTFVSSVLSCDLFSSLAWQNLEVESLPRLRKTGVPEITKVLCSHLSGIASQKRMSR